MPFLDSLPEDAGPPAIFARHPAIYEPWAHMSEALMNGASPLSQGERELILAFAAGVAGCDFVRVAHEEVAYAWGIERGLIARLLTDFDGSALPEKTRVLLALVRKLAVDPGAVARADIDAVLAAGWDEHALHDAVAITARAAFMQRLAQGYGFTPLTPEVAAKHAKRRVERGYVNLYPAFRSTPEKTA